VIADCQTLGRGRRGARWWQPPGSLAVSLVVGPAAGPRHGPRPTWSLVCGIALAESIRELEPTVAATVRWPNDIEVAGRKLAGILVETSTTGRAVFGVGVNTTGRISDAPEGLRGRLITIPDLTGQPLSRRRHLFPRLPARHPSNQLARGTLSRNDHRAGPPAPEGPLPLIEPQLPL
jgi:BirA family biotin operon repressor/biotin-[acetyl-CoA-carboxylase] ligase